MSKNPPVSVCIPAYNESESILNILNDISEQDYDGEVEVVVCDNASSDDTGALARAAGARVIREEHKGTRYAYDAAMRAARHDLILVTNADTRVPKNWISRLVEPYKDETVVGVGSDQRFYDAPRWVNAFLAFSLWLNPTPAMWGVSLSCRKSAFKKIGGFNQGTDLNEDAIFSLKLKKIGKVVILHDLIVLMDGRRFNRGTWDAVKQWFKGFGINAFKIQLKYMLFGQIRTKAKTFEDIRETAESPS